MVKQFKNRVRIADVQKEFDTLCSRIDNLNQKIQDVTEIGEDFDYSEGSSQLAAAGYTLTVGGLKKALEACDGTVLGARAFRVNDSHIKMSGGYLITKDGGYRLPDSYLTIPQKFRTLYFNPETKQYQWTARGSEIIIVEEAKQLIGKSAIVYRPVSEGDDYYQYKQQADINNHLNYIAASNLYNNAGQAGNHIDLLFYKTTNLLAYIPQESGEHLLTYNPSEPNKVRLNIGDYVYVANNKLSVGDKINIQYCDGTLNTNNIILGTLSDNAEYFTPKFDINFHTYAGGGLSQYLITDVCGMTNNPAITSVDSTVDYPVGGKCASVRLDRLGATSVHYNNDDNSAQLKNIQYSFTQDEILPDNKYFRVTVTNSNNVVYTSDIRLPDSIENYNINCIIFHQFNAGANASFYDGGNRYIRRNLNKLIKGDETEILLAEDYNYTEWVEREVEGDDAAYKICDINMNRGSIYANDHFGVQNENIYGTYEISIPNRTFPAKEDNSSGKGKFTGWLDWGSLDSYLNCYEAVDNSSAPKFVVPICCAEADDGDRYEVYFNNLRIAYRKGLHRWCNWQTGMNYIYLPKGVANPFNYKLHHVGWDLNSYDLKTDNPTKCSAQKQFNVKISKKLKQKTL